MYHCNFRKIVRSKCIESVGPTTRQESVASTTTTARITLNCTIIFQGKMHTKCTQSQDICQRTRMLCMCQCFRIAAKYASKLPETYQRMRWMFVLRHQSWIRMNFSSSEISVPSIWSISLFKPSSEVLQTSTYDKVVLDWMNILWGCKYVLLTEYINCELYILRTFMRAS